MNLLDLISHNNHLNYVDATTGNEFGINDLLQDSFIEFKTNKELAFLYLDNQIESIKIFWNFFNSKHCLVLLAPTLNINFKKNLEQLYTPKFIYDATRTEVENYSLHNHQYFVHSSNTYINIHPLTKVLLSTSGTTGSPKFVALSESNLLNNALSIVDYLPINKNDITPLNLPIYYSYGLSVLTSNSIKGGKIVCSNLDVLNREFWQMFDQYQCTSIAGVPFVYEMLDRIGFTKKYYPSLKYCTQAGGKLQNNLVVKYGEYAQQKNIDFFVMYGQTEATARMSYLPSKSILQKIGSIGKPIKNGEFIIDETTNELCYKGPNVFGGYITQPNDLANFERTEILHTGDVAHVDEDGFYYITGRLKRFVKLFGNRTNLDEIESLISKQFGIVGKAIGIEDKALVVFILGEDKAIEIKQYLFSALKIHPTVIQVKTVGEFPLTSNGKVDYTALQLNNGFN